jgi:hypothetical protein
MEQYIQRATQICGPFAKPERIDQMTRSLAKMKNKYNECKEIRNNKIIIVLSDVPKHEVPKHSASNFKVCQATTMKGEKCKFKAVCNGFCKKHSLGKNKQVIVLGEKPKINIEEL